MLIIVVALLHKNNTYDYGYRQNNLRILLSLNTLLNLLCSVTTIKFFILLQCKLALAVLVGNL